MRLLQTAALAVLVVVGVSRSEAAPCARKDFKTVMVKTACEKGGQDAAKDAMKAFAKDKGIKSCNQCHAKLAPTYELKADGLSQFAKAGGQLLATPATPKPDPAKPKDPAQPKKDEQPSRPDPSFAPPIPSGDPQIKFEKYTLENGLEVILAPDPSVPLVSVNVWYHVGSGYETVGKSGFAHLFEHMMFQGSKHVPEDTHFDTLKKIGVTDVNGTTNSDRTNYYETVPSNQVETALWLESDRMGYLLQPVPSTKKKDKPVVEFKESLANQIEVVRNERRQRYDNTPYGKTLFAVAGALYPEGHPYRYLTIGKHEDLANASVADVQGFFKTWYVPANATLAIVGDFEVAEMKKLVDKWFGKFPKSSKPKVIPVPAPTIKSTTVTVDDSFAKLRQIQFIWHSPAVFAPDDAELEILGSVLGREGTGRLYKALVYDRPLAQSVSAFQGGATFSGKFQITVTLRSEADLEEVKKIVAAEVAKARESAITDKELQRVLAANEAATIRGLESPLARADQLQSYNHYLGNPDRLTWDLDRYRKTTPDKVRAAAAKYLLPDRMVTAITNPAAKEGGKQ